MHQCDSSTDKCLRRNMANHHAVGTAGETPIGDEPHRISQSLANEGGSGRKHFAHAGPSFGALVAYHHHIARLDFFPENFCFFPY